jgi:hypothetical protein
VAERIAECLSAGEVPQELSCRPATLQESIELVAFVARITGYELHDLRQAATDQDLWKGLWQIGVGRGQRVPTPGGRYIENLLAENELDSSHNVWVALMSVQGPTVFELLGLKDLSMHLDILWLPGAEDFLVIDPLFRWLIFIDHEGYVHLAASEPQ